PFMWKMSLLIIDAHSKWLDIHIVNSATTESTVEKLRMTFSTHGLPEMIVSDNGSVFTSEEFKIFNKRNGIKHVTSSPYHPAINGLVERAVQTFKQACICILELASFAAALMLRRYSGTSVIGTHQRLTGAFTSREHTMVALVEEGYSPDHTISSFDMSHDTSFLPFTSVLCVSINEYYFSYIGFIGNNDMGIASDLALSLGPDSNSEKCYLILTPVCSLDFILKFTVHVFFPTTKPDELANLKTTAFLFLGLLGRTFETLTNAFPRACGVCFIRTAGFEFAKIPLDSFPLFIFFFV
ncbi:hypothetical protein QZH41_016138, partial [Actinostola sp. cb2023]